MSARLDVVATGAPASPPVINPSDLPTAAMAAQQAQLSAGTEAGLAARAVLSRGITSEPLTVDLGALNAALGLASSPAPFTPGSGLVQQVPVPDPPVASAYSVYLVITYTEGPDCGPGTASPAKGTAIEDLVRLIP